MFHAAVLCNASTKPFSLRCGQKENQQLTITKGHCHWRNGKNVRIKYWILLKCAKYTESGAKEIGPMAILQQSKKVKKSNMTSIHLLDINRKSEKKTKLS